MPKGPPGGGGGGGGGLFKYPPRAYLNTPPQLPHMNKAELRQCTEIHTNYIMVQISYLTYQQHNMSMETTKPMS